MSTIDIAAMTLEEAREFVAYIRNQQRELPQRIQDAWRRRAWVPLGYPSWDAMCVGEHIQLRGLPRDERQEIVVELRAAGMSTRAIGSAIGASDTTVVRDLQSTASNEAVEQPETVTSLDGRQRPAARPARPEPEPSRPAAPVPTFSWPSPAAPEAEPDPLPAAVAEEIDERIAIKQTPRWLPYEQTLRERLEAGETIVVTLRGEHERLIAWAEQAGLLVRIDRRTEWGNPFEIPGDGDRGTVIANYEKHYLPQKPSLIGKLDSLRGRALACWCSPEPCHGDVLAAWADGRGEQC